MRHVLISLAFGVVATIAIAWSLAVLVDMDSGAIAKHGSLSKGWRLRVKSDGEGIGIVDVAICRRVGATVIEWYADTGETLAVTRRTHLPEEVMPAWAAFPWRREEWPEAGMVVWDARGWPFASLRATYVHEADANYRMVVVPRGGLKIGGSAFKGRWSHRYPAMLPLIPVWPGFALNVLVIAAHVWLVMKGFVWARTFVRRRRGLCLTCGYASSGIERCPECGVATGPDSQGRTGQSPSFRGPT